MSAEVLSVGIARCIRSVALDEPLDGYQVGGVYFYQKVKEDGDVFIRIWPAAIPDDQFDGSLGYHEQHTIRIFNRFFHPVTEYATKAI